MFLQSLVEVNFLARHGFGFYDQPRLAFLGETEDKIGDVGRLVAEHHLSAICEDVGFELGEVVIQVFERVLLELMRLIAKLLVVGQPVGCDHFGAMIDQAARGRIDRLLQPGIVQSL